MRLGRGPNPPRFPLSIAHPLGPLFRQLPIALRRHLLYLNTHNRWGNFTQPRRFTEKIQWRIINDKRALIALACDKLASKALVASRWKAAGIGDRFKTPELYWVGTTHDEFLENISNLPERFVLKPNHTSGRFVVVDRKSDLIDAALIGPLMKQWMLPDEETLVMGHWGYSQARRVLFAEERIGIEVESPVDLRFFTNRGAIVAAACTGTRSDGSKWTATYDADFGRRVSGHPAQLPLDAITPLSGLSPSLTDELRSAIHLVSAEFDQVRVDMYRAGDTFYFGELTVYSSSGLVKYNDETDYRLGAAWELPELTRSANSDPG